MEDIYKTYADEVKKFLICLTSDVDLAEELTQETFYQAVKSINRYNGKCKMSVWLCQIAKHSFYNYLKKHKQTFSIEELTENGTTIADKQDLPDIKIESRDTYISIHKEIHWLDEPYKEIFLLRTLSELSFREIGEIFSKNENWARVTYYRAKTKLFERVKGINNEM